MLKQKQNQKNTSGEIKLDDEIRKKFQDFLKWEKSQKQEPPSKEILELGKEHNKLQWMDKWLMLKDLEEQISNEACYEKDESKLNNIMTINTLFLKANETKFTIRDMKNAILEQNNKADKKMRLNISEEELEDWKKEALQSIKGYKFLTKHDI